MSAVLEKLVHIIEDSLAVKVLKSGKKTKHKTKQSKTKQNQQTS